VIGLPSLSKLLLATRLALASPHSVFLREAQPPHQPPDGGVAQICSRYVLKEATSLADGGAWALLYVLLEEGLSFFVCLAESSGAPIGGEGISLSDGPSVSLDRGKAHVEGAGRSGF
jgi:hypothetical protein